MSYTLVQRLGAIDKLAHTEDLTGIRIPNVDFNVERRRIIGEFLGKQPIARDVYAGRDSFESRLEDVTEKYSGIKALFTPRLDETFDEETRETISAMNAVGNSDRLDPNYFTTANVRSVDRSLRRPILKSALGLGVGLPLVVSLFAGYDNNMALKASAGVGVVLPIVFGLLARTPRSDDLFELKTTARSSDEYLGRLSRVYGKIE